MNIETTPTLRAGPEVVPKECILQYNVYKRHDDLQVRTNIYIYIYKIDRGGNKTILGPAGARSTPAGKMLKLKVNKKLLQDHISHKSGHVVLL